MDREISQLRAIARESTADDGPAALGELFGELPRVARLLLEPRRPIARSTGRARLLAAERFIRIVGPALGRNATVDLATLDRLLPSTKPLGWHTAGTVVAGEPRRRHRGPTLDGADLDRIVDQAGVGHDGERAARDRALVALHGFSGLRPEEIVGLRWEDVARELTPAGFWGLTAGVSRRGVRVCLLLPGRAGMAIQALAEHAGEEMASLSGPVFRARGRSGRPLGYRSARAIVHAACRRVGLPAMEAVELRAAFAAWLRAQGLSDHEVADVLGLAKVRSVDGLLRGHAALAAQRILRETLGH